MDNLGIHIFRRDLRTYDNLGLFNLMKFTKNIIYVFFLDINQILINEKNQHYFSYNVVQFMCESLIDLNNNLLNRNNKLFLLYGNDPYIMLDDILKKIKNMNLYNEIYINYNIDFSPYSIKRDGLIDNIIKKNQCKNIITDNDMMLINIEDIVNDKGSCYKQFGAFYKKSKSYLYDTDEKNNKIYKLDKNIKKIDFSYDFDIKNINNFWINKSCGEKLKQKGGRINGLKKIKKLSNFNNYNDFRDRLDYDTTNISAYLNFGCISIREVYNNLDNDDLIKQLIWRDFFLQAYNNLENAKRFNRHIDDRFDNIKWKSNNEVKDYWKKLIDSKTGFLLIDAGMNELKQTGYLHNRCRLIIGYFWTKYLLINPFNPIYGSQVGFSKYLVDAIGPTQNKMNHHWLTEFDYSGKKYSHKGIPLSGRPIDISNKNIKKFDPECNYIKKWMPELINVQNKDLFKWSDEIYDKYKIHVKPIFNPKKKYDEWIKACDI